MTSRTLAAVALVALPAGGCVTADHQDGISVSLALVHHFHHDPTVTNPDGAPRVFVNGAGDEITVNRGWLVVFAAELVECTGVPANAIAHTIGNPTLLDVQSDDDLMRADQRPLDLGVIGPPPSSYCSARLTLAPADAAASGVPPELAGKTLHLEGTWTPPGGGPRAFTIESAVSAIVEVPFRDEFTGLATPLTLDAAAPTGEVVFATAYDEWFDGVDLGAIPSDDYGTWVMAEVAASVHDHAAAVH